MRERPRCAGVGRCRSDLHLGGGAQARHWSMTWNLREWGAARSAEPERRRQTAPEHLWRGRHGAALPLVAAYLLLVALPLLTALALRAPTSEPLLYEVARAAALLAFSVLALQVVLAARFKLLDKAFGLDVLVRFHRGMGILASVLLLAHPALLLLSTHGHIQWEWRVALGAGALLILAIGVVATLSFRLLRGGYDRWRFLHKGMILVLALGYVHSRSIGDDLLASSALRAYWTALLAMALGVFLWRNAFVPRWGRHRFRVESVAPEARGIFTLRMVPEDGRPMTYQPGQFVFLTLLRPGLRSEEHPFTISSSPLQSGFITVTVKQSGDYTSTIGQTRAGDRALIEGPFGKFSLLHHDAERFLFIGAGVGSTPLASMIRFLRDSGDPRHVLFICANRTQADIPFREELERLPANMNIVHILSRPEAGWSGARGHLDEEVIRELAGPFLARADVYLCGPPALMGELRCALKNLGVRRERMHTERFALP
jgi:predicted ferric reductase